MSQGAGQSLGEMNYNSNYTFRESVERLAATSRADINRYMLLPLLPAAALLDLAYYLHSKGLYHPVNENWIIALNGTGALVLLCCGVMLVITLLLKTVRRHLPARRHLAADYVAIIGGFLASVGLGMYITYRVARQYDRLERAALATRGVTVSAPVTGRQFQGGLFAEYRLFFRIPGALRSGRPYSVAYPHEPSVDTVKRLRIRYLPANPEIYRCVDAWHTAD